MFVPSQLVSLVKMMHKEEEEECRSTDGSFNQILITGNEKEEPHEQGLNESPENREWKTLLNKFLEC